MHSLSEGEEDSITDDGAESKVDDELCLSWGGAAARMSFSRAHRVFPGSLGYAPASGDGSGMLVVSVILSAVLNGSSTRPFDVCL